MMEKGHFGRRDRLVADKRNDTYRKSGKWREPTQCEGCGAAFLNGRWSWKKPHGEPHMTVCPACRRIEDHYPAGYVEIKGTFFQAHSGEVMNLVRNLEAAEKQEHPLERIISVGDEEGSALVTTTGVHLARRIGDALSRAYQGTLSYQYGDGEKNVRVSWERELIPAEAWH